MRNTFLVMYNDHLYVIIQMTATKGKVEKLGGCQAHRLTDVTIVKIIGFLWQSCEPPFARKNAVRALLTA